MPYRRIVEKCVVHYYCYYFLLKIFFFLFSILSTISSLPLDYFSQVHGKCYWKAIRVGNTKQCSTNFSTITRIIFKLQHYKICLEDFFILSLKVNTELQHYLPIIKTLITALTKLPKNDDNYRILASKHMLTCVLKGYSFFFFFCKA